MGVGDSHLVCQARISNPASVVATSTRLATSKLAGTSAGIHGSTQPIESSRPHPELHVALGPHAFSGLESSIGSVHRSTLTHAHWVDEAVHALTEQALLGSACCGWVGRPPLGCANSPRILPPVPPIKSEGFLAIIPALWAPRQPCQRPVSTVRPVHDALMAPCAGQDDPLFANSRLPLRGACTGSPCARSERVRPVASVVDVTDLPATVNNMLSFFALAF
jgi:hypothetical protein